MVKNYNNTSLHSSIKTTSFQVVYGREPLHLFSYKPGTAELNEVEDTLEERDKMLKVLGPLGP